MASSIDDAPVFDKSETHVAFTLDVKISDGPLVDKWTNTDCLDCLWEGAMMGNKTAAARRITLLGFGKTPAPAAPNPAPSAYVSDVPDTQKGFKGSSSLGWDEDWD